VSDLLPGGETLRRALDFIAAARRDRPEARLAPLVDEACLRFDLGPRDQEFLWAALLREPTSPSSEG
jgi:hypothetical protein